MVISNRSNIKNNGDKDDDDDNSRVSRAQFAGTRQCMATERWLCSECTPAPYTLYPQPFKERTI